MRKISITVLYVFIIYFLCACSEAGSQGSSLVSSSGRSSEVLVVCDNTSWNSKMGDSIREVLLGSVPALPQAEPMFRLSHIDESRFSPIYQKQRNILIFKLQKDISQSKMLVEKDKWAKPQVVITLTASDEESMMRAFEQKKEYMLSYIMDGEMRRFQRAQRSQEDRHLNSLLQKKYKLSMVIPEGFFFAVKDDEFCWLRKETKYWGQNLMIYGEQYTDTVQFSQNYIKSLRNKFTRHYVFGSVDSSYVQIDDRCYPLLSKRYVFHSSPYSIECRGLWGLFGNPGDKMGGPFVSYTFLDTIHDRVICVDGFLYAPSNEKRDLLRQLEAILLTAEPIK